MIKLVSLQWTLHEMKTLASYTCGFYDRLYQIKQTKTAFLPSKTSVAHLRTFRGTPEDPSRHIWGPFAAHLKTLCGKPDDPLRHTWGPFEAHLRTLRGTPIGNHRLYQVNSRRKDLYKIQLISPWQVVSVANSHSTSQSHSASPGTLFLVKNMITSV